MSDCMQRMVRLAGHGAKNEHRFGAAASQTCVEFFYVGTTVFDFTKETKKMVAGLHLILGVFAKKTLSLKFSAENCPRKPKLS